MQTIIAPKHVFFFTLLLREKYLLLSALGYVKTNDWIQRAFQRITFDAPELWLTRTPLPFSHLQWDVFGERTNAAVDACATVSEDRVISQCYRCCCCRSNAVHLNRSRGVQAKDDNRDDNKLGGSIWYAEGYGYQRNFNKQDLIQTSRRSTETKAKPQSPGPGIEEYRLRSNFIKKEPVCPGEKVERESAMRVWWRRTTDGLY